MTDITETLTEGEQREIRQYITARLAGGEINMNALPLWLFDLEQTRHKEQQLRVELKRVLAALWLVYDLYKGRRNHERTVESRRPLQGAQ